MFAHHYPTFSFRTCLSCHISGTFGRWLDRFGGARKRAGGSFLNTPPSRCPSVSPKYCSPAYISPKLCLAHGGFALLFANWGNTPPKPTQPQTPNSGEPLGKQAHRTSVCFWKPSMETTWQNKKEFRSCSSSPPQGQRDLKN